MISGKFWKTVHFSLLRLSRSQLTSLSRTRRLNLPRNPLCFYKASRYLRALLIFVIFVMS